MTALPFLTVTGRTLPVAWERSLIALWRYGQTTRSQFAPKGRETTIDSTMAMVIEEPLAEPRIHRCQPGGLEDLWVYTEEVQNGVHDHWINPAAGQWSYTYHKRLTDYEGLNQLSKMMDELVAAPHTRRAQGITWMPGDDLGAPDPPCLQRVWMRLVDDPEVEGGLSLVMNLHWRSRDAFKAAFMNLFALTELQRRATAELAGRLDRPVACGRVVDVADSYHLYSGYLEEFQAFWKSLAERSFEQRTFTQAFAEPSFADARIRLEDEKKRGL